MIEVGNTAGEVRSFLRREERASPPTPRQLHLMFASDMPILSALERQTIGNRCDRCGARPSRNPDPAALCVAPTGLPASAPHAERIAG